MNYEGQKNRHCFLMIVQNSYMLKFCSLEDNRITYPKSIGSLGLCYTNAEISERKVDRAIILQANVDKFALRF